MDSPPRGTVFHVVPHVPPRYVKSKQLHLSQIRRNRDLGTHLRDQGIVSSTSQHPFNLEYGRSPDIWVVESASRFYSWLKLHSKTWSSFRVLRGGIEYKQHATSSHSQLQSWQKPLASLLGPSLRTCNMQQCSGGFGVIGVLVFVSGFKTSRCGFNH